jgi:prevent-host-death family protein
VIRYKRFPQGFKYNRISLNLVLCKTRENCMNLSKNIKPISYLKANAAQVALELKDSGQAMVITQNGEATMVVQAVAEYERMQETLALLKILAQSQQAVNLGKTVSSADAFSRLRAQRGLK